MTAAHSLTKSLLAQPQPSLTGRTAHHLTRTLPSRQVRGLFFWPGRAAKITKDWRSQYRTGFERPTMGGVSPFRKRVALDPPSRPLDDFPSCGLTAAARRQGFTVASPPRSVRIVSQPVM